MPTPRFRRRLWQLAALATVAASALLLHAPRTADAALPAFTWVEGALVSSGAVPAADGDYDVVFGIYAAESGGQAVWSEGPVKVKLAGGRFTAALGGTKALDGAALIGLSEQWLGVTIGSEPELPRRRLASVPMALVAGQALALSCSACVGADQIANGGIAAAKVGFNYAGAATKGGPAADLDCTGCVTVAELKFDGDVDLGGNSLKAKNGIFSGDLAAKSVTAASFVGDGSKLTGIVMPAGTCKPGEVVKGIKADNTLDCGSFAGSLPGDSIAAASNGVITNVFKDAFSAPTKDIAIPDNTGSSATSEIVVPDLGLARDLTIQVKISNSDLAGLSVKLLPPDDKAKGWTLCDPCGKTDEKTLDGTWSVKAPPPVGDIQKWIGGNPKGAWTLKVLDASFCIPQKPGNAGICDLSKQLDGKIVDWSMAIETLSNNKIADPKGHLYARVVRAGDEALGAGKHLEIDTMSNEPGVVAQAWVYNPGDKTWLQAATGVDAFGSCTNCGSGKDGDFAPASNTNLAGKAYEYKSFVIPKGVTVTVTGTTALTLKVIGKVDIQGTLLLSGADGVDTSPNANGCSSNNGCAAGGAGGPGGAAGGQGCYGQSGTAGNGAGAGGPATYCSSYGVGGGGAGYGTNGENGKVGSSSCQVGSGGGTYNGVETGTLVGGSGGGGGSYGTAYNSGGGGGGGGGGAVRIDAGEIIVSGAISANGGRGGHNTADCDGGGGGGGSGGGIWLRAGKVTITGQVTAVGGAFGDAMEGQGSLGGDGGNGGVGQIRIDAVSPATGTTKPTFKSGSASDLGATTNSFTIGQPAPGVIRLTNTSGSAQNVRLVVTY